MHLIKYSPLFKSFISILPQRKWICIQNARSFDDFLIDVKTKTKTCEIGSLEDSLIRNGIVCSTDSKEMRERVLRDSELMLTKAANMVTAFEIPIIQVMIWKVRQQQISFKISKFDLIVTIIVSKDTKHSSQNMKRECYYCGTTHRKQTFPAYGKKCLNRKKLNHFASVSRSDQ